MLPRTNAFLRWLAGGLAGFLIAAGSLLASAQTARAATACGSDDKHFFAGATLTSSSTIEGVFSNPVTVQTGTLCSPNNGYGYDAWSNGWNMLVDASGGRFDFVQSGWGYKYGNPLTCFQIFSEDKESYLGQLVQDNLIWYSRCINNGENHVFYQKDENCSCSQGALVHSGFDNIDIQVSLFNPLDGRSWPQPDKGEISGETKYIESDVPGYSFNHSVFQGIAVQLTNGSFYYACDTTTGSTVRVSWTTFEDFRYTEILVPGYCPGSTGTNTLQFWTSG